MANELTQDPYRAFNFWVEIGAVTVGQFQECSGLDSQTASVDYREGRDPNHLRKLPGLNSFTPITLKRGVTDSDDLWKWRLSVVRGRVERLSGSIILLNEAGEEKKRWNFFRAWPSKWTGPAFNATGNAVAIETLEITHEELVRPTDPLI